MNEPKRRGRPPKNSIDPETIEAGIEYGKEVNMESENKMTCWASIGATINLGNFQSQKIDIGLAGVPVGTTPEELEVLLEGGKATLQMVIQKLGNELVEKVEALGGYRF